MTKRRRKTNVGLKTEIAWQVLAGSGPADRPVSTFFRTEFCIAVFGAALLPSVGLLLGAAIVRLANVLNSREPNIPNLQQPVFIP